MPSYVLMCKNISFESCVTFQKIFFYHSKYTPFESVDNLHYFHLAVIGELGGILNSYCKTQRKRANYSDQTIDEVADAFIYLLIGLLEHENKDSVKKALKIIQNEWDATPSSIASDAELLTIVADTLQLVSQIQYEDNTLPQKIQTVFINIKRIGLFTTGLLWQQIIDIFHQHALHMHLDPKRYTLDFWFQGSGHVDFQKLLDWIKIEETSKNVMVPDTLKKVFARYSILQKEADQKTT